MSWLLEFGIMNIHGRDFHAGLLMIIVFLLLLSMIIGIRISKKCHLYEKEIPAMDASDQ